MDELVNSAEFLVVENGTIDGRVCGTLIRHLYWPVDGYILRFIPVAYHLSIHFGSFAYKCIDCLKWRVLYPCPCQVAALLVLMCTRGKDLIFASCEENATPLAKHTLTRMRGAALKAINLGTERYRNE